MIEFVLNWLFFGVVFGVLGLGFEGKGLTLTLVCDLFLLILGYYIIILEA